MSPLAAGQGRREEKGRGRGEEEKERILTPTLVGVFINVSSRVTTISDGLDSLISYLFNVGCSAGIRSVLSRTLRDAFNVLRRIIWGYNLLEIVGLCHKLSVAAKNTQIRLTVREI